MIIKKIIQGNRSNLVSI